MIYRSLAGLIGPEIDDIETIKVSVQLDPLRPYG
jgi:hypothetical protein